MCIRDSFTTAPDGIPGNDDTGTMSAWAVFSMMGFYPDCPGEPYYTLTSPVFDRVTVTLDRKYYPAGELVIETERSGAGDVYIGSMTLGGRPLKKYRISHGELVGSGMKPLTKEEIEALRDSVLPDIPSTQIRGQ